MLGSGTAGSEDRLARRKPVWAFSVLGAGVLRDVDAVKASPEEFRCRQQAAWHGPKSTRPIRLAPAAKQRCFRNENEDFRDKRESRRTHGGNHRNRRSTDRGSRVEIRLLGF
jgi:hypothetical protein